MATVTASVSPPTKTGPSAITITQPGAADARGDVYAKGNVDLTSPLIKSEATVTVTGTPGENLGHFKFGFIQLKFITDDWAQYRGPTTADGSVFLAFDRPPARPRQLCRDTYTIPNTNGDAPIVGPIIFYDGDQIITPATTPAAARKAVIFPLSFVMPASGSVTASITFRDSPERPFDVVRQNTKFTPARANFIHSLQTGAAYATVFAIQKGPASPIEPLYSFQWNVRFRAHFGRDAAGSVVQLPARSGDVMDMNVSHVFKGGPTDPHFRPSAVTDTTLPVCETVVNNAFDNPVLHMSRKWEEWKVKH
jgi:hypothetical protein